LGPAGGMARIFCRAARSFCRISFATALRSRLAHRCAGRCGDTGRDDCGCRRRFCRCCFDATACRPARRCGAKPRTRTPAARYDSGPNTRAGTRPDGCGSGTNPAAGRLVRFRTLGGAVRRSAAGGTAVNLSVGGIGAEYECTRRDRGETDRPLARSRVGKCASHARRCSSRQAALRLCRTMAPPSVRRALTRRPRLIADAANVSAPTAAAGLRGAGARREFRWPRPMGRRLASLNEYADDDS
jgi:hypothetical protein